MATSTIGSGQDYTTLTLWEDAKDGLSQDDTGQLTDSGERTEADFTFDGKSSSYRWTLQATGSAKHDGTFGSGAYITNSGSGHVMLISDSLVTLQDLDILQEDAIQATSDEGVRVDPNDASSDIIIQRCIVRADGKTTDQCDGIYIYRDGNLTMENCVVYGFYRAGIHLQDWTGTPTINIYARDVTADASGTASSEGNFRVQVGAGTRSFVVKNCVGNDSRGTATEPNYIGSGEFTGTNNATSATTDSHMPSTNGVYTITDTDEFTTIGSDYHIKNTGDLYQAGIGPASDSDIPTDDIVGETRQGTVTSIGAFQFLSTFTAGSPGRSLVKPKVGTQLNKTHRLAEGLVGAWLFNEGSGEPHENITGKGLTFTRNFSAYSWEPFGGNFNSSVEVSANLSKAAVSQSDFTIVSKFEILYPADGYKSFQFGDGAVNTPFAIAPYNYDSTYWSMRTKVGTATGTGADDITYGFHTFALVVRPGASSTVTDVYMDGKFKEQLIAADTPDVDTSKRFWLSGYREGGFGTDIYTISYCYVYDRALSASEIKQLYIDPYAMFGNLGMDKIPRMLREYAGNFIAGSPRRPLPVPKFHTPLNQDHRLSKNLIHGMIFNEGRGRIVTNYGNRGRADTGTIWQSANTDFEWKNGGLYIPTTGDYDRVNLGTYWPGDIPMSFFFRIKYDNLSTGKYRTLWCKHDDWDSTGGKFEIMFLPLASNPDKLAVTTPGNTQRWDNISMPTDEKIHSLGVVVLNQADEYHKAFWDAENMGNPHQYYWTVNTGDSRKLSIGNWADGDYDEPLGGIIYEYYWFDRELTQAEFAWLHRNPYGMFRKESPGRFIYTASTDLSINVHDCEDIFELIG